MRNALFLTAALTFAACTSSSETQLKTRFVERSGDALLAAKAQGLTNIEGLYFGELEIVAYDHRPGQNVQSLSGFGHDSITDREWSYWVALQSGHDAGRDNVLQVGEQIDFAAMNGEYNQGIDQEFIDEVGRFEIDLFEVYMHRTGALIDGHYYGMNAEQNGLDQHPLHKYPQWSSIDDTYCQPEFPGFSPTSESGQDLSVFFVRNDWFSQPTTVVFGRSEGEAQSASIKRASPALNATQEELLLSLVNQGTRRRFYDRFVLIPYAGPVVLDLTNAQTPPEGEPGPAVIQAGHVLNAQNVSLDVSFDLVDIIDDATDLSPQGDDPLRLVFKGDSNHVPFGLTLHFTETP